MKKLIQNLTRVKTFSGVTIISYNISRRHLFKLASGALFVLAAPVSAYASSGAGDIGSGRLLPTAAALAGLVGVIIGRRALARSRRTGAIVATILGLVSLVVGGLHAANSAGSFGTGNGLAGAMVAIVLGLIALLIGSFALVRLQRTG